MFQFWSSSGIENRDTYLQIIKFLHHLVSDCLSLHNHWMVTNKGDRSRNLLEIYDMSNYNKFMIPTTQAGVGYYGHNQRYF